MPVSVIFVIIRHIAWASRWQPIVLIHAILAVSVQWALYTRLKIMTCSRLLKTGCNNVVLPILFIVVNNIVQHCWAWINPQSGSTMLNNIVDNYKQYGQHNIVASCFQQPWTSHDFLPCIYIYMELTVSVVHSSSCVITRDTQTIGKHVEWHFFIFLFFDVNIRKTRRVAHLYIPNLCWNWRPNFESAVVRQ